MTPPEFRIPNPTASSCLTLPPPWSIKANQAPAARTAENGKSRYVPGTAQSNRPALSPTNLTLTFLPQCDEVVPACSQCINTKRDCPGYIARFDLVLRDQTKAVRRKAQRKKLLQDQQGSKLPSPPQSASPDEPVSTTGWTIVNPGENSAARAVAAKRYSSTEPVPRMFNDFPEQQAICAFFLDFVLIPRHPDTMQGHLEHLLPLYANTAAESPLSLATSAVALMISGGLPTRKNDQQLGRTHFGRALRKTSAAIRNPVESRKDETLMAVLLLGLFEVCWFSLLVWCMSAILGDAIFHPSSNTALVCLHLFEVCVKVVNTPKKKLCAQEFSLPEFVRGLDSVVSVSGTAWDPALVPASCWRSTQHKQATQLFADSCIGTYTVYPYFLAQKQASPYSLEFLYQMETK